MKLLKTFGGVATFVAIGVVGWVYFQAEQVSPYDVEAIVKERAEGVHVGNIAPSFTLKTLSGTQDGYLPRPGNTIIHFFATWCYPCQEEMPFIVRLHEQLRAQGDTFLAVNLTHEGDRQSDLSAFLNHFEATFDPVLDERGDIQQLYQIVGIPTTIVIGRDGIIEDRITGALSPQMIDQWVSF
ncbi:TlpA disulfide reductase family protein [Shouchella lonarensis]|uniref:Thiol-disulfide isomerase or thioredoxin n=1 Tax=Shouchella lonarensis TaxID=1464122 RepID=A0A1G6GL11_9BACI|nr:TlpA disulfide reductase family protein [Shouchella lonarensis]SDB82691.1 Thiol-disulfide isomerase or thioredoxin [Shouchella lonarensis]